MTKEEHTCDNVNCNHNNTKGLCCLHNPENCKYRQLQKENVELKKKCYKKAVKDYCELENENKKLKEIIDNDVDKKIYVQLAKKAELADVQKDQLTKAKQIIKSLLRLWNDVMTEETVKALVVEAEQFLSEVEK